MHQPPNGQAALLTADGFIAHNSLASSQLTTAMLQDIFIKDVVIDVGLARGTLIHPLRFIERIEKWIDFWPMWEKMKKWHIDPHLIHTQTVEKHVPESIKKNTASQKPQTFFSKLFS
jgi:hypothetical protein